MCVSVFMVGMAEKERKVEEDEAAEENKKWKYMKRASKQST